MSVLTRYLHLALLVFYVKISEIQLLKCRSREHVRQEEDFYYLVNKCLKESVNGSNSTADLSDHRQNQIQPQRPQQPPMTQIYQQQRPQHHQQQKPQQPGRYHPQSERPHNRKPNEDYPYNADQYRDSPYDARPANKNMKQPNFEFNLDNDTPILMLDVLGERSRIFPNTCTCVSRDGQIHRYGFNERYRNPSIQYNEKRETISSKNYDRTNSTNNNPMTMRKSPLENIDACVIHCIFRDLKMVCTTNAVRYEMSKSQNEDQRDDLYPHKLLNDENKVDRQSMLLIMTLRIQEPELKEFIEDSIDECYDFLDTGTRVDFNSEDPSIGSEILYHLRFCHLDNHEEQCNISKKLALCLEERAKRACDDWEVRGEITATGFNTSRNYGRHRGNENRYNNEANQGDGGSNSLKNGFNKWNLNFTPRKQN